MQQSPATAVLSRDQAIFLTLLREDVDAFFPLSDWQGTRAELERKFYSFGLIAKNLTSTLELSHPVPVPEAAAVQYVNGRKRKADAAEVNDGDRESAPKHPRLSLPRKAKKSQ